MGHFQPRKEDRIKFVRTLTNKSTGQVEVTTSYFTLVDSIFWLLSVLASTSHKSYFYVSLRGWPFPAMRIPVDDDIVFDIKPVDVQFEAHFYCLAKIAGYFLILSRGHTKMNLFSGQLGSESHLGDISIADFPDCDEPGGTLKSLEDIENLSFPYQPLPGGAETPSSTAIIAVMLAFGIDPQEWGTGLLFAINNGTEDSVALTELAWETMATLVDVLAMQGDTRSYDERLVDMKRGEKAIGTHLWIGKSK